jgi:hypothetical protein
MSTSVGAVTPLKPGHKGLERFPKPDRLRYFDQLEAGVLGQVLSADKTFLAKADKVAEGATRSEREKIADEEARAYAPKRKPHRAAVAQLLLVAAEKPWQRHETEKTAAALRRDKLQNVASSAYWHEDIYDGAQRVRARFDRLWHGADRIRRQGAGRCIGDGCETPLSRYNDGHYCSLCAGKARLHGSHRDEMRDAFDAASGQRHARREKRRGS